MSWRASQWAIAQTTGSATVKAVLLVLAEAVDMDVCATTIGTEEIGRRAEMSRRSVVDALAKLQDAGLIARARRFNATDGTRTSDRITVLVGESQGEAAAPRPADQSAGAAPREGCQGEAAAPREGVLNADYARLGADDDAPKCSSCTLYGFDPSLTQKRESSKERPSSTSEGFLRGWDAYPSAGRKRSSAQALCRPIWTAEAKRAGSEEVLIAAVQRFAASEDARRDGGKFVPALQRWLRDRKYEHWLDAPTTPLLNTVEKEDRAWRSRIREFSQNKHWQELDWGPRPTNAECRAPKHLLQEFGFGRETRERAREVLL